MQRQNVRHACLAVKAILFILFVGLFVQARAADGSISPNKADLDRIRLQRVSLSSLEDTPPRLWRAALSQLYSGRVAPQRGLPSRLEPIARFLSALGQSRAAVPGACAKDGTLPSSVPYRKLLVASNLKDNSLLLPQHMLQLLITVGGALPEASTFVSIYESGSTDSTAEWLLLLDDLLDSIGVPHKIVTQLNGGIPRRDGQERIDFLAHVRNLAVSVIQPGRDGAGAQWQADRLLFLNDVYFCAQDIIRLLQHTGVDLACGMDFNFFPTWKGEDLQLYDKWVMREADGSLPTNGAPYVTSAYSRQRILKGWTIPVSCCWNGIASINAQPFLHGLQFRTFRKDECRECEGSNMCTDFWDLGYTNFIVDPGVRVAYEPEIAEGLHDPVKVPIPSLQWAGLQQSPAIDMDFVPRAFHRVCCSKETDSDLVYFKKCTLDPSSGARVFARHSPQMSIRQAQHAGDNQLDHNSALL